MAAGVSCWGGGLGVLTEGICVRYGLRQVPGVHAAAFLTGSS